MSNQQLMAFHLQERRPKLCPSSRSHSHHRKTCRPWSASQLWKQPQTCRLRLPQLELADPQLWSMSTWRPLGQTSPFLILLEWEPQQLLEAFLQTPRRKPAPNLVRHHSNSRELNSEIAALKCIAKGHRKAVFLTRSSQDFSLNLLPIISFKCVLSEKSFLLSACHFYCGT